MLYKTHMKYTDGFVIMVHGLRNNHSIVYGNQGSGRQVAAGTSSTGPNLIVKSVLHNGQKTIIVQCKDRTGYLVVLKAHPYICVLINVLLKMSKDTDNGINVQDCQA